jgi:hypothetical protein
VSANKLKNWDSNLSRKLKPPDSYLEVFVWRFLAPLGQAAPTGLVWLAFGSINRPPLTGLTKRTPIRPTWHNLLAAPCELPAIRSFHEIDWAAPSGGMALT